MNIENNRFLFLACVGLTASGSNGFDHDDVEVTNIVKMIHAANFPDYIKNWFARARTGQIEVNPYWPRGSCLASACFFVDNKFQFNKDLFFKFLESIGVINDPISLEDFKEWISETSSFLQLLDQHPSITAIWDEYCRVVKSRSLEWEVMIKKAVEAAQIFFGDDTPEIVFTPNLFTPYSVDFVRIGNRIITISSNPDAETMLHETLHTAIAKYRSEIMTFAEVHGLTVFADKTKMIEFGYLENDSASSIAHVIEECFVRAFSVVFSGGNEDRLQFHAQYGCDSVPFIASRIKSIRPSYNTLGNFVNDILNDMKSQDLTKTCL